MDFKEELFCKLWKEKEKTSFEQWIYNSSSVDFENCVGEKSYLEIISGDLSGLTIKQLKQFVYNSLSTTLKDEFKVYVKTNQKVLKAICIKTLGSDYDGKGKRNWELNIGREYFVLGISVDLKNLPYKIMFQLFDPLHSGMTPYFVPAELFEINGRIVPPQYSITVADNSLHLDPMEFVDKNYEAVEYSFWEDYLNDHEKAVRIFKSTIERLDIASNPEEYEE